MEIIGGCKAWDIKSEIMGGVALEYGWTHIWHVFLWKKMRRLKAPLTEFGW